MTINIISFYKDKKQNNLVYNDNNYMAIQRCLFGSRPIKTHSRLMCLDNLLHDAADFGIGIIFIPVLEGANLPQMSDTTESMSMKVILGEISSSHLSFNACIPRWLFFSHASSLTRLGLTKMA